MRRLWTRAVFRGFSLPVPASGSQLGLATVAARSPYWPPAVWRRRAGAGSVRHKPLAVTAKGREDAASRSMLPLRHSIEAARAGEAGAGQGRVSADGAAGADGAARAQAPQHRRGLRGRRQPQEAGHVPQTGPKKQVTSHRPAVYVLPTSRCLLLV